MPNLIITGADGFVGRHLARAARLRGYRVIGISKSFSHPELYDEAIEADLAEAWPATPVSDAVVHLAGLAAVGPSFLNPQQYLNVNSSIVTNMCEALLDKSPLSRVIAVSTGAVYDSKQNGEISESGAIAFSSPYAVSKILTENQIAYYSNRGLSAAIARPFNHIGPGQGLGFIVPDLYEKLTRHEQGSILETGNLLSERDYTDVRDVAEAYLLLAEQREAAGIFNVCSGTAVSGLQILKEICNALAVDVPLTSENSGRAIDPSRICGDSTKLRRLTGWSTTRKLEDSIRDFVLESSQ